MIVNMVKSPWIDEEFKNCLLRQMRQNKWQMVLAVQPTGKRTAHLENM
jgi:hypothetical protein